MTLAEASTPRRDGDHFAITFPSGWLLGRGVFGGLVFASLARAMEMSEPDAGRRLRSLSIEIPAPVLPDVEATITVEVIRRGAHTSTLYARLHQRGVLLAHASGVLAEARATSGRIAWSTPMPVLPHWRDLAVGRVSAQLTPEFIQHFDYRLHHGMPLTGGDPYCDGWVQARDPGDARDAGYLAAVIDAWWPTAFVALSTPRPASTIAFKLDIVGDLVGLPADAPLCYRGRSPACTDGYFVEVRELWGDDGRLLAINQQTFVLIA